MREWRVGFSVYLINSFKLYYEGEAHDEYPLFEIGGGTSLWLNNTDCQSYHDGQYPGFDQNKYRCFEGEVLGKTQKPNFLRKSRPTGG